VRPRPDPAVATAGSYDAKTYLFCRLAGPDQQRHQDGLLSTDRPGGHGKIRSVEAERCKVICPPVFNQRL